MLALNVVLAIMWMTLQRSFTLADFVVGFGLGLGVIMLTQRVLREQIADTAVLRQPGAQQGYPQRAILWLRFIGFALWSIIKANWEVAKIVVRPRLNINPGIIAIPLDVKSEIGITVLANLITLTPGTVSLDVSSYKDTIYVHCIDIQDADAIRDDIKQNFERRVMELFP
ncbi:MAG: Na+/H+ antiporter subunit E [Chloroflexi bacterium OHK40]